MRQTAEGIQSRARWEVQGTEAATPGTGAGELRCPKLVGDDAPIRKLSAKNLLPGLTGKVIRLAGKAKTHKENRAGWHYLLRSLLSPCRLTLSRS